MAGNAEAGDPVEEESICICFGGGLGHWYCLWSVGGPVDASGNVGKAMRGWKQTHKVHMNMAEWHLKDGGMMVLDSFVACFNPRGDVSPHASAWLHS